MFLTNAVALRSYHVILPWCWEFVWGNPWAVTTLSPRGPDLLWGTALSIMRSVWGKSQPWIETPEARDIYYTHISAHTTAHTHQSVWLMC